jgi:hypothetical protein
MASNLGIIAAVAACLLAVAALLLYARMRARAGRTGQAAGRSAGGSGRDGAHGAAGHPEAAWVSRITQSIPMVAWRAAQENPGERPAGHAGAGLQGNLAQTPLHDLLQYLALGRKSGLLELVSGRRTGRMILSGGRITASSYRGKEGMDAAFLMLDLAEGDFEFFEPETPEDGSAAPDAGAQTMEVVDAIMMWMARKPRKKPA